MATSRIVTGYIKTRPRVLFDMFEDDKKRKLLINRLKLLREPGVYVLYRDEQPYYVGKTTKSLFSRIHSHANKSTDTYYHFWNSFRRSLCRPKATSMKSKGFSSQPCPPRTLRTRELSKLHYRGRL